MLKQLATLSLLASTAAVGVNLVEIQPAAASKDYISNFTYEIIKNSNGKLDLKKAGTAPQLGKTLLETMLSPASEDTTFEATESEVAEPEITEPEATETEIAEPEVEQPENTPVDEAKIQTQNSNKGLKVLFGIVDAIKEVLIE